MKTIIALAAALSVLALPAAADAATKNRHRHYNSYARAPGQIVANSRFLSSPWLGHATPERRPGSVWPPNVVGRKASIDDGAVAVLQ